MVTFGLELTKMVHINLTETHLKNLNHNEERRTADNIQRLNAAK
jgi:hypothetical protein